MGLFGFIKKAIGTVAKAGLSVVTHGVSDKVISSLKSKGIATTKAANQLITDKAAAQIGKLVPQVTRTAQAAAPIIRAIDDNKVTVKAVKRSTPAKRKAAAAKKAAPRKTSSGAKRTPPKGGLDLAAIARAWRKAGKPGTWQGYIKSNPIKKR